MHEMSITEDMLAIVLEYAGKNKATKVGKINLVVGEMTGFVEESVRFYFEFLGKDTIAAGAEISFTKIPARGKCRSCGNEYDLVKHDWTCPYCQSKDFDIVAGKELFVESIEVK